MAEDDGQRGRLGGVRWDGLGDEVVEEFGAEGACIVKEEF